MGVLVSFNDGDFIQIEYSAWRASDGSMVYTTDKAAAEKNGLYSKDHKYGPNLVIVGKDTTIKGLDKALRLMSLNESRKVEIGPDEAFGERNQDLVRVMKVSDFRSRDIDPRPGMQVDLDGTIAVITAVNSGRFTVDANHPLAGEKLTYDLKVVAKLDDERSKVDALAGMNGLKPDSIKVEGGTAEVLFGEKIDKNADYFLNKASFTGSVLRYLPGITKVVVKEEYVKREEKKEG